MDPDQDQCQARCGAATSRHVPKSEVPDDATQSEKLLHPHAVMTFLCQHQHIRHLQTINCQILVPVGFELVAEQCGTGVAIVIRTCRVFLPVLGSAPREGSWTHGPRPMDDGVGKDVDNHWRWKLTPVALVAA